MFYIRFSFTNSNIIHEYLYLDVTGFQMTKSMVSQILFSSDESWSDSENPIHKTKVYGTVLGNWNFGNNPVALEYD